MSTNSSVDPTSDLEKTLYTHRGSWSRVTRELASGRGFLGTEDVSHKTLLVKGALGHGGGCGPSGSVPVRSNPHLRTWVRVCRHPPWVTVRSRPEWVFFVDWGFVPESG